jgi:hypothetical protein
MACKARICIKICPYYFSHRRTKHCIRTFKPDKIITVNYNGIHLKAEFWNSYLLNNFLIKRISAKIYIHLHSFYKLFTTVSLI